MNSSSPYPSLDQRCVIDRGQWVGQGGELSNRQDGSGSAPDEPRALIATELTRLRRRAEDMPGATSKVASLAVKVNKSRQSVYSYLKGEALPARDVLRDLMRAMHADDETQRRLLELHEEVSDQRPDDPSPVPAPAPAPDDVETVRRIRGFVFAGRSYDDTGSLAAAFRGNWSEGLRLIQGWSTGSPQADAFIRWLRSRDLEALTHVFDRPRSTDRTLTELIVGLDPDSPPTFAGRSITVDDLRALAGTVAVRPDRDAGEDLQRIFGEGILTLFDGLPGAEDFALVDDRWHRMVARTDQRVHRIGARVDLDVHHRVLALLLVSALDGNGEVLEAAVQGELPHHPAAWRQRWFEELTKENGDQEARMVQCATILACLRAAAAMTIREDYEAEATRRGLRANRRRGIDELCLILGSLAALISCAPYAGLVLGPAAFYCGMRGLRTRNQVLAIAILIFAVIGFSLSVYSLTPHDSTR